MCASNKGTTKEPAAIANQLDRLDEGLPVCLRRMQAGNDQMQGSVQFQFIIVQDIDAQCRRRFTIRNAKNLSPRPENLISVKVP